MVYIRPREATVLSAIRRESHFKRHAKHMHKRFRSWTQKRVRAYRMNLPVVLTADSAAMDGQYIAACCQKAASNRKHDVRLWYGYSRRVREIAPSLNPEQLGYILYGFGKARFLHEGLYRDLVPHISKLLPDFWSHPLMIIAWAFQRVQIKEPELMEKIMDTALSKMDSMRPADIIRISNIYAKMGLKNPSLAQKLSSELIPKWERTFATDFREVISDVSLCQLYDNDAKKYIMERFRRAHPAARPQHYLQAYRCAVALRVLFPDIWEALPAATRAFYVRLSLRRIYQRPRFPSAFHWEVSNDLVKLGVAHRNTFR